MWICKHCENEFDEPKIVHTSYELYYGVASLFDNSTPLEYLACPYCGDENITEKREEEGEEE